MSILWTLPALTCLSSLAPAQSQVHVVDSTGAPGTDFTSIDAAIAAAASGDVLLVRQYLDRAPGHSFPAKRLTLVGEPGRVSEIRAPFVGGLGANDFVLFQGLDLRNDVAAVSHAQNDGVLWFERCILGDSGNPLPTVRDCAAVVLTHGTVAGGYFGPSLGAQNSGLFVFDCAADSIDGQFAFEASASTLELFGSRLRGLDGVAGSPMLCLGTSGGSALSLEQASDARLFASDLSAGVGFPSDGLCGAGRDGVELTASADSSFRSQAGSWATLEFSSPVRTDERVTLTLRGTPGERAWLLFSRTPGQGFRTPQLDGSVVVGGPWKTYPLGEIPAGGTLVVNSPAPRLMGGNEAEVFFSQVLTRDPVRGRFVVSAPSALVVLDARF